MATKSETAMNSLVNGLVQYVDNKINTIPYVKTDIGVVQAVTLTSGKYLHTVKVRDFDYTEIKSLGNCQFNVGSVVYILVPNGQYNNMFILGHLDDTNANIKGGTINIGNGNFTVDSQGNMTSKSGKIASFNINSTEFSYIDETNNRQFIIKPTTNFCFNVKGYNVPIFIVQTGTNVNQIEILKYVNDYTSNPYDRQNDFSASSDSLLFSYYYPHQPEWGSSMKYKKYINLRCKENNQFLEFRENLNTDGTINKGGYLNSDTLYLWDDDGTTDKTIGISPDHINADYATVRINKIYCNDPPLSPSDRNKKKYIKSLNSKIKDFIMSLNPVSYKFKDDDSNKTHYGLIAQDVEDTMNNLKLSSKDFAIIDKKQKVKTYREKITNEEGYERYENKTENIEGEYDYHLSYQELIAPLIKTVQLQQEEINELRKRIDKLEKGE